MRNLVKLFVLYVVCSTAVCDYPCVCSSHVQRPLYRTADVTGYPSGFLYDSECGPQVQVTGLDYKWLALAFNHQVVYIERDYQVTRQVCPGQPDPRDKTLGLYPSIPNTTAPPSTHIPSPTTSVKQHFTTAQRPHSQTTTPHGPSTHGPTPHGPTTHRPTNNGPTHHRPTTHGPTHHRPTTHGPTPHLPTTHRPTTHGPTTPHGTNRHCPNSALHFTAGIGGQLGQFYAHCYVLAPVAASWLRAKDLCVSGGGILLEVYTQAQQTYVQQFVHRYTQHPVWLGLTDILQEEHFRWESGVLLSYTNWSPARKNAWTHNVEDCAVLVTGAKGGVWDDVPCGYSPLQPFEERHLFVCQYVKTSDQASNVLVG